MPHRARPMAAILLFTGLNAVLLSTITPVYDFVCFLPYWERRREHRHQELEAALKKGSNITMKQLGRMSELTAYHLRSRASAV